MDDLDGYTLTDAIRDCVDNARDVKPVLDHVLHYISSDEYEHSTVPTIPALLAKLETAYADAQGEIKPAVADLIENLKCARAIACRDYLRQYVRHDDAVH